jgi:hypothetical protein
MYVKERMLLLFCIRRNKLWLLYNNITPENNICLAILLDGGAYFLNGGIWKVNGSNKSSSKFEVRSKEFEVQSSKFKVRSKEFNKVKL